MLIAAVLVGVDLALAACTADLVRQLAHLAEVLSHLVTVLFQTKKPLPHNLLEGRKRVGMSELTLAQRAAQDRAAITAILFEVFVALRHQVKTRWLSSSVLQQ